MALFAAARGYYKSLMARVEITFVTQGNSPFFKPEP